MSLSIASIARRIGGVAGVLGCLAAPACAEDPFDFGGPRSCEIVDQNEFVYGVMQQVYLFADELPTIDPADYEDPASMVRDIRVAPDRWSRVSDRTKTEKLYKEGAFIGLGYRARRDEASGDLVVESVHATSPAAAAGLQRGDRIRRIGGLRIAELDEQDAWGDVLGEDMPGVPVDLGVQARDDVETEGPEREVTLVKDWIAMETVPIDSVLQVDGRAVGYVLFSSFIEPADAALDAAFERFRDAGVKEVIVDLRYNGGGLLSVARHLVGLLVGDVAAGKPAYRIVYNDAFSDENTDRDLARYDGSIRDVQHVVFLATRSTLSASELVINAVRPYTRVTVVGATTGGKPVGSRHFTFCDKVAAPITFKVVNADGEGDYFEGIPADCSSADDITRDLGDADEATLAGAIAVLRTGTCAPAPDVDESEDAAAGFAPGFSIPRSLDIDVHPDAPIELRGTF